MNQSESCSEDFFPGCDGQAIFYRVWRPAGDVRAVLLIAHGLAEHGGRYTAVAEYFCSLGYAVAALDHVGHGRSEGDRGFVERFAEYVETLEYFRRRVLEQIPTAAVVLIGHSMGGLISAAYLLRYQQHLTGCVLSGAALRPVEQPSRLVMACMNFLSSVFPHLGTLRLDAAAVSRDAQVMRAYLEDPLVYHGRLSARLAVELFGAMASVEQRAAEIRLPLLILHGEADRLTHPAGSRNFHQAVGSEDKTLMLYPGLYHEIFNEPEREQVLADVSAWLDRIMRA